MFPQLNADELERCAEVHHRYFAENLKKITPLPAIFPGNINQYVNHIDAFGLNTDNLRLIRLFIQPVLIYLALWSTGGWQQLKSWWQCLTKSKKA